MNGTRAGSVMDTESALCFSQRAAYGDQVIDFCYQVIFFWDAHFSFEKIYKIRIFFLGVRIKTMIINGTLSKE